MVNNSKLVFLPNKEITTNGVVISFWLKLKNNITLDKN